MPDNTAVTVRVPLPAKHLKPSTGSTSSSSKPESKPDVKVKAKVTVQTKFAKIKRYRTAQSAHQSAQQGDPTCQPS